MRKDSLRSTRSSSRARTSESGFALALAVVLAVLYFGLIQLLMMDASGQLAEARRFRARIVALTAAENAAELAAADITNPNRQLFQDVDEDTNARWTGRMQKAGSHVDPVTGHTITPFLISAEAETIGVVKQKAKDRKSTRLNSSHLVISYAVFCL